MTLRIERSHTSESQVRRIQRTPPGEAQANRKISSRLAKQATVFSSSDQLIIQDYVFRLQEKHTRML